MDVNMLLESVRESLHQVGVFLPRLLLAIVILVVGWVIAKAVRFAVVKALRAINFGVVTEKAGIDHFLKQGGAHIDTVRVLGGLAYWLVILAALMVASNSLDLAAPFRVEQAQLDAFGVFGKQAEVHAFSIPRRA